MKIREALEIVLSLATENAIEPKEVHQDPSLHDEYIRQTNAIETVEGYDFQFEEESQ